ncbi:MAG: hypothetical protein J6Z27_02705 [Bacteroidales bacterium]|nr:hypothetical protein [Bacteroidales bacterium]
MKKNNILLALAAMLLSVAAYAQGAEQALLFSQRNQIGSARTLAMGNAFTAVGGDLSAISVNPASSGMLMTGEFSFTGGVYSVGSESVYLNSANGGKFSKFGIPNLAFQTVMPLSGQYGWQSVSMGVSINRVASFNSAINAAGTMSLNNVGTMSSWLAAQSSGITGIPWDTMDKISYNNTSVPWRAILAFDTGMLKKWGYYGDGFYLASTENVYTSLLGFPYATVDAPTVQSFSRNVVGGNDEIAINLSGNYNDFLYLGANLNIYSLSMTSSEVYRETAVNSASFDTGFQYFQHSYTQTSSGVGVGLKFGAIVLPAPGLRLGLTVSTPTWYNITDSWYETMRGKEGSNAEIYKETPTGQFSYRMVSPMRVSAGLAYTFGSFGLLSVDWEMTDYGKIRLTGANRLDNYFQEDNSFMRQNFLRSHLIRAGLELNITPGLALRGGYNYYTPVSNIQGYVKDSHYYSAGIGLRLGMRTFLDLGYQGKVAVGQRFSLYSDYDNIPAPVGTIEQSQNLFLATLRIKM